MTAKTLSKMDLFHNSIFDQWQKKLLKAWNWWKCLRGTSFAAIVDVDASTLWKILWWDIIFFILQRYPGAKLTDDYKATVKLLRASFCSRWRLCAKGFFRLAPETTPKKGWQVVTRKSMRLLSHPTGMTRKSWLLWPSWKERFQLFMHALMRAREKYLWMVIATSNCCTIVTTFSVVINTKKFLVEVVWSSIALHIYGKVFRKENFRRNVISSGWICLATVQRKEPQFPWFSFLSGSTTVSISAKAVAGIVCNCLLFPSS